jgi:hypothetical protein
MLTKFPEDDRYFAWTRHIKNKMVFYGLSESRIKGVLRSPKRKEEGIAPNTTAVMKRNDRGKKKEEIWVMFQKKKKLNNKIENPSGYTLNPNVLKTLMISAWRYPGISKKGNQIPIPEDILEELENIV